MWYRLAWLLGVAAAVAYGVGVYAETSLVCAFLKPVPLVLLILWVAHAASSRFRNLMLAGLALSLVGDVFLIPTKTYFLHGLVYFLCAHLCYVLAFIAAVPRSRWLWSLPFVLWGGGIFYLLQPGLHEMLVPVLVYMIVICAMMWRAASCFGEGLWGRCAGLGALSFGLSDSLLAIDLFYRPFALTAGAVMLTYWLGQALLACAAVHQAVAKVKKPR